MSKLWDDLKKNMKDWSAVAVEKAEEVSKIAVSKTEELTKISKIKIDIHQLRKDMLKTFEQIGSSVYENVKAKKPKKFMEEDYIKNLIASVDEYQSSIKEKEEEIVKIKEATESLSVATEKSSDNEPESEDKEK